MTVTIYHNPRCSKSRQTLKLLEQHSLDLKVIEYLKTPPDREELGRLLDLLDLGPRGLIRTGEPAYRENRLDDESLDREQLIGAMVEHPILIERPIVVAGNQARIGRPPERVLEIIPQSGT